MHEPKRIKKWVRGEAPGFLIGSIKENYDPPSAFVSLAELEEQARAKKQAEQELLAEYRQAQEKVKTEIGDWADLSPEQRISGRLDLWIMEYRRRHGKNPSEDEERRRSKKYIQELPTQEQMLANQLNDLRRQFEQKAKEQGLSSEVSTKGEAFLSSEASAKEEAK